MGLIEEDLENEIPTILRALMDPSKVLRDEKERDVEAFDSVDISPSFESDLVVYTDQ